MLNLFQSTGAAPGYTVYANDEDPSRFFALPKQVALSGVAATLYRRAPDAENASRGGGIFQFTVEPTIPDADLAALQQSMSGAGGVVPMEFVGGRLEVDVDGVLVLDAGAVDGAAHGRRAVMLTLGAEGAARLADTHTLPLEVAYTLTVQHRLPPNHSLAVTTDGAGAADVLRNAASGAAPGDEDPALTIAATLLDGYVSQPRVQGPNDRDEQQLLDVAREELARRVRGFLAANPAPADDAALQKYSAAAATALSFSYGAGAILQHDFHLEADLGPQLAAVDWAHAIAVVDLHPQVLKVSVLVTADFANLPIDSVKVTLAHHGARDANAELLFRQSGVAQQFHAWLAPGDQPTYDWTARVYFKNSQVTYTFGKSGATDQALVIPVGGDGLVDVTVQLGAIDFAKLPKAQVDFRYQPRAGGVAAEGSVLLDKDHLQQRWLQPVGELRGPYQYQVGWALFDGGKLVRPWQSGTESRLLLNSPFVGTRTVLVDLEADPTDADPIAKVVLTLRYADPDNGYQREATSELTASYPGFQWSVDLIDTTKTQYQYRSAVVRKSGAVQTSPAQTGAWITTDLAALVVGDVNDIKLTIDPSQLHLDGGKLVQVDLVCEAAPGLRVQKSIVFGEGQTGAQTWSAASGAPPGPRSYTATVTYYSPDGSQSKKSVTTTGPTFVVPAS